MHFNIIFSHHKIKRRKRGKEPFGHLLSCPRTLKIWPHQDVVLLRKNRTGNWKKFIKKTQSNRRNEWIKVGKKKVTKRFTCCMCDRYSLERERASVSQLKEAQQIIATCQISITWHNFSITNWIEKTHEIFIFLSQTDTWPRKY